MRSRWKDNQEWNNFSLKKKLKIFKIEEKKIKN